MMSETLINQRPSVTAHISIGIFIQVTVIIFVKVNEIQPEPYMDEIFHIPQAQHYCRFNYSHWDDKITTLPGLYYASQLILQAASLIFQKELVDVCTTFNLRMTNMPFLILCGIILFSIIKKKHAKEMEEYKEKSHSGVMAGISSVNALYISLVLCSFPLLYFNAFLYYTDVVSTCFVLCSYLSSLYGQHSLAAMLSGLSIVVRQTNVVWLIFIAGCSGIRFLEGYGIRQENSRNVTHYLTAALMTCWQELRSTSSLLLPYILIIIAFLKFLVSNGGIVVGDKSSHEACANLPQICYLSVFMLFFSSPCLLHLMNRKSITTTATALMKPRNLLIFAALVAMTLLSINKFTYVHPYLISDNRHYPFYIWKRLMERHWSTKYLLAPFYVLAWLVIVHLLAEKRSGLWIVLFILCCAVVTIPQKLLEFRYFVLPYLFFRLNMKMPVVKELLMEAALYSILNTITFYLFLYKPFYWEHEPKDMQRFMW